MTEVRKYEGYRVIPNPVPGCTWADRYGTREHRAYVGPMPGSTPVDAFVYVEYPDYMPEPGVEYFEAVHCWLEKIPTTTIEVPTETLQVFADHEPSAWADWLGDGLGDAAAEVARIAAAALNEDVEDDGQWEEVA